MIIEICSREAALERVAGADRVVLDLHLRYLRLELDGVYLLFTFHDVFLQ